MSPRYSGFGLGPDLLHRLDPLTHQFEAGLEDGAVVFHLVLVPAAADPEQKAAVGHLIERSDELGGLDRVALLHQADAGPDLELRRGDRGRGQ